MTRWNPTAFERALHAGDPVDLRASDLGNHAPDQIVPLCHAVSEPAWQRWLAPAARPRLANAGRTGSPRVTVVIPTADRVPVGLAALLAQDEPVVVHVLWNGAGSPPEMDGVHVRRVPWLGHGRTRQEAVAHVETELLLFLVDDAVPLGAGFVRTLVEALERLAADAVWSRQVPWPSASRRVRDRLRAWCPADDPAPLTAGRLDHVCALHRVDLLRADPLDDVPIAEDWLWGRRHKTALVAGAPVCHSHPPGLRRSFQRTRDIHNVLIALGEPRQVDRFSGVIQALPRTLLDRDALGELLGQWAAARGAGG